VIRASLAVLLLAAAAFAGDRPRLDEGQRAELVRLVGEDVWSGMPPWRQHVVADRYARFLDGAGPPREGVDRAHLREWLLQAGERDETPPPLADAIGRLPPQMRPLAGRFVAVRIRQLRLDRSLARLPFEERREIFERLFPEPFSQEAAHAAYQDLCRRVARSFARSIKEEISGLDVPRAERREMVRSAVTKEEGCVMDEVRRELERLADADPERARRFVERFLAAEQDNIRFLTPRQRELVRYAIRPEECPLIDPGFLGPPPADPAEKKLYENDFRVLARLDLLTEAGFPREMVLHLAGAGTPEDFLRAIQRLSRPPGPPGPPEPPG
jgi:hypothetical protein